MVKSEDHVANSFVQEKSLQPGKISKSVCPLKVYCIIKYCSWPTNITLLCLTPYCKYQTSLIKLGGIKHTSFDFRGKKL
jgi:hypothetical protein